MKKKYYKKPYRIKRKKSIFKNRFFWLGILLLIMTGGLFYFLFFYPFFDVKEIIISGNKEVKKEEIENLVKEQIQTDFKFLKNKNINLIKLNEIDKILLENFPQIARVSSKKELPDVIIIEIEERKPAVVFKQNNNWFFADKEGIIFRQINEQLATQTAEQVTIIQNLLLTKELKLGERIAEKEIISQIIDLELKLKEDLKIPLEELTIVSEERLNAKTSDTRAAAKGEDERSSSTTQELAKGEDERSSSTGWEIYFNLKGDINWQILKLKAILENRIPPEKRGNINYIDLRFERVYIFPENYNQ